VPGWDGDHEWDGDVPRDELPCQDNPPNGYLVTANNRTTTADYPHYLTYMSTRFRADRLHELLGATNPVAPEDCRRFQSDTVSIQAREMLPSLVAPAPATEAGRALQDLLRGWDANLHAESPHALAFDAVLEALVERTVRPYFAKAATVPGLLAMEERRIVQEQLMAGSALCLDEDESWDAAIAAAVDEAAGGLVILHGPDLSGWRWGARHEILWRHNLGRGTDLGGILNIGPVPVGGDGNTPFNTASERGGRVTVTVSYRQIFDLADLNAAQVCIPPGNSGQPGSPHYADNVDRWCNVEYHPLFIDWTAIEASAEGHLELQPA
jgi:penicillin amidase